MTQKVLSCTVREDAEIRYKRRR